MHTFLRTGRTKLKKLLLLMILVRDCTEFFREITLLEKNKSPKKQ